MIGEKMGPCTSKYHLKKNPEKIYRHCSLFEKKLLNHVKINVIYLKKFLTQTDNSGYTLIYSCDMCNKSNANLER